MEHLTQLNIKLYADGADKNGMLELYKKPMIKGLTTNPTLMRKAGILDYEGFALDILKTIHDKSISFEVFADEFSEMEEQAYQIAAWGKNVMVKIPVTNTKGQFAGPLIKRLSHAGVPLNVTAILTVKQVKEVAKCLSKDTPAIISVFAGRIADTGIDPVPVMKKSIAALKQLPKAELLWASPRELLNVIQANDIGCHIITSTPDILNKLALLGKNLDEYSLETVQMFYKDACTAGYMLKKSIAA